MSKGSSPRRPSVSPEEFAQKFDAINWNAREQKAAEIKGKYAGKLSSADDFLAERAEEALAAMNRSPAFTLAGLLAEMDKEQADAPQAE